MSVPASTEEGKSASVLRLGSLLALGGALAAVAVPAALVLLSRRHLYGLVAGSRSVVAAEGLLVAAGAVLGLLAFLLYRRAFGHLRHADPWMSPVSAMCLLGSVGALAVVVAGALVSGGSSAVTDCLGGRSAHPLACLRAADPTAGYLAMAGFWLVWVGALGLCVGLVVSGRHFRRRTVVVAGILYAVLLVDVLVPFAGALAAVPGTNEALAVAPLAAVAAPILVYVGTPGSRPSPG